MKKNILIYFLILAVSLCVPILFNTKLPEKKEEAPKTVTVYFQDSDEVKTLDIEEYLVGVVAGEMPAAFEEEALKAQAVAARTFIYKKISDNSPAEAHKGALVCNDATHCKAYLSPEKAQEKWGDDWKKQYEPKLKKAVDSTKGEIIVYNNEPITAVFFSMSGGKTENSKDIWGGDLPYLKSVDSSFEKDLDDFETKVTVTKDEFINKLRAKKPEMLFGTDLQAAIKDAVRTEGGSVKTIGIGDQSFTGQEIRTIFDLRSANFEIALNGSNVEFTVYGYGHGVGMSQYGANCLAQEGKKYDEILKTYYSGVEIIKK